MRSYFSFTLLTYVNIVLMLLNASITFPFSAIVPVIILGIGMNEYAFLGSIPVLIVYVAAALICASVYLLLYFLAKKRLWPVVTALVLIIIDTLIVLFFAMDDFSNFIIDIVFHAWVLWSVAKLIGVRKKRARQAVEMPV